MINSRLIIRLPSTALVIIIMASTHFFQSCAFSSPLMLSTTSSSCHAATQRRTIHGPSSSSKPDYDSIHGPLGPLLDRVLTSLFRSKLSSRLGRKVHPNEVVIVDSQRPRHDYGGIIDITHSMNSQYTNRTAVQSLAQDVLISLFPTFILERYPAWFSKPFPAFSSKMCAIATVVFGTWLMGECEVNDIPSKGQGVLVKRCRFLEESQCASICVNSCKIPTQNFFSQQMGLGLTMTPDYETGECQFAFGILPTEEQEREARETPCLSRCPSGGGLRNLHNGSLKSQKWIEDLNRIALERSESCMLMVDLEANK